MHEGDYLGDDGIHQKKATLAFDGTEDWTFNSGYNVFGLSINTSNMSIENSFSGNAKNIITSSHFTGSIWYNLYHKLIDNAISGHNVAKAIEIRTTQFNSLDSWKTYLSQQYANGTPVTVEYELAEENIIPYTEEQQYSKLRLMNEGQNTITTIGDIKPNIECDYYYNNDLNKAYANRFDEVEKAVEEKEIYSKQELKVGKWIDEKELYRTVIEIYDFTKNGEWQEIKHHISNVDFIYITNVIAVMSYSGQTRPISSLNSEAKVLATKDSIMYSIPSSISNLKGIVIVLEYTKS